MSKYCPYRCFLGLSSTDNFCTTCGVALVTEKPVDINLSSVKQYVPKQLPCSDPKQTGCAALCWETQKFCGKCGGRQPDRFTLGNSVSTTEPEAWTGLLQPPLPEGTKLDASSHRYCHDHCRGHEEETGVISAPAEIKREAVAA